MEKFTFFYGGFMSQWWRSSFGVDGVIYNTAEQYMMAEKARLFGDAAMEAKILSATDPKDQKKYGRLVEGFDKEKWNAVAREIVYKGNYNKFVQNPHLMEQLLETAGTTLVEASPYDEVWGIKLSETDPRRLDRATWQGTNWLGQVLTKLRDDFLSGKPISECRFAE